jgi:hypothetical protein
MTYAECCQAIATQFQLEDPKKIRLYGHIVTHDTPKKNPFRVADSKTVWDMLYTSRDFGPCDKLYYEVLKVNVEDVENKIELHFRLANDHVEDLAKFTVYAEPKEPLSKCFDTLKTESKHFDGKSLQDFRAIEIFSNKVFQTLKWETLVCDLQLPMDIRVENNVPDVYRGQPWIQVQHYSKEHSSAHLFGEPFILGLVENETIAQLKTRIFQKLQMKDEMVMKKIKFSFLVSGWKIEYFPTTDDTASFNTLLQEKLQGMQASSVSIGLEQKNPNPSRWADKPVVIKV